MDLTCGLDQILKMGAGKEVTEVDKFAVLVVLNINGSPAVLSGRDGSAVARSMDASSQGKRRCSPIDGHGVLGSDDGERNEGLLKH